jgi:ATP-binding cassette subfamily C protein
MRRELRFGAVSLRRRPLLALVAWSVPEAVPAALSGFAVARAVDAGFLAGRPLVGLAWLGGLLLASAVGAVGARQAYRRLGDLVEPFRDDLVRRVVRGALHRCVAGQPDGGAVARLTHQVEIVRDTYAGLIVVVRGFMVQVAGAVVGLLAVAPMILALVLPMFLIGLVAFLGTLNLAATRQRAYVAADERLSTAAGSVLAGVRDVVAGGAEEHALALVAGPAEDQAAAERALARAGAAQSLCFALGGWVPLLALLAAGPWLVARGLTAGAIIGGLTYVLQALQPALNTLITGMGRSGLRFVVTLGRILDATAPQPVPPTAVDAARVDPAQDAGRDRPVALRAASSHDLTVRGLTFAYGPHAEPVLRELHLTVANGDHLAIVGPSGVGKSTLAGLLCGLLRPDAGLILLGSASVCGLRADELAARRVLIPQESYVFTGTLWDNLTYLRPDATIADVEQVVSAVGAGRLVDQAGGWRADLRPERLSAGERQLVALVRAYLSPARVAVLDEATCHLEPAAERCVEDAFAARGGTLVVIAHRISSALRARRVLVLNGTHAVEGDHATLLAVSPLYRELLGHWEAQPQVAHYS